MGVVVSGRDAWCIHLGIVVCYAGFMCCHQSKCELKKKLQTGAHTGGGGCAGVVISVLRRFHVLAPELVTDFVLSVGDMEVGLVIVILLGETEVNDVSGSCRCRSVCCCVVKEENVKL